MDSSAKQVFGENVVLRESTLNIPKSRFRFCGTFFAPQSGINIKSATVASLAMRIFWLEKLLGTFTYRTQETRSPMVGNVSCEFFIGSDHFTAEVEMLFDQSTIKTPSLDAEIAWNFYIGGYQPAQRWLKDRKGRTMDFEDILHYQKIIVALYETDRLMKEVVLVGVEW